MKKIANKTKELVYINIDRIIFSNSNISQTKLDYLKNNFSFEKLEPVCAYFNGKGYILTDGNHRVKVLQELKYTNIPAVILTKDEYDFLAYSKVNTILFRVSIPEKIEILS